MNRILEVASREERLVVGLSSGTSADGVDAALVRISGQSEKPRAEVLNHDTYPYPVSVRKAILGLSAGEGRTPDICRLGYLLGGLFADACLALVKASSLEPGNVDAIGSHGQTVCHLPPSGELAENPTGCTLQLGEPAVIAERTGAIVVSDFRSADMAAGGEGAPLAPCLDHMLFGGESICRGFLNIGGIANLTVLPSNGDWKTVMGFDTGPGNMVVDHIAGKLFAAECDDDGRLSGGGRPSQGFVETLLKHEFFSKAPPKSAGREIFGGQYSEQVIRLAEGGGMKKEDLLATAVMLTARSVHRAYEDFVEENCRIEELYVSGGGVRNRTLIALLKDLFAPVPVHTTDELGVPSDAKEALLFAVLANQAIIGVPSSLPQVTGAARRVVLGKITA